jgi:hypothetical protein
MLTRAGSISARLWPKLRAGYPLDALDRLDQRAASPAAPSDFLMSLPAAAIAHRPSARGGRNGCLNGVQALGSALELDSELLQRSFVHA